MCIINRATMIGLRFRSHRSRSTEERHLEVAERAARHVSHRGRISACFNTQLRKGRHFKLRPSAEFTNAQNETVPHSNNALR